MTVRSSEEGQPSLLETHGGEIVEYRGISMPLRALIAFCPIPHEEMDPAKVNEVAQALLDGKDPFSQAEAE